MEAVITSYSIHYTKLYDNGFSNPVNPRSIELVLQDKATGKRYFTPLDLDLRKFELNSIIEISTVIGIPGNISDGDYALYLALPDPELTIKNNPDFAIRLANKKVWDPDLGINA